MDEFHIESIPTVYKSRTFRSRTEARWAVFFDYLDLENEYEKQFYEVEPDLRYLPDFWIPSLELWIEIKGQTPSPEEKRKAIGLYKTTQSPVYIFVGKPQADFFYSEFSGNVLEICSLGIYKVDNKEPNSCNYLLDGTVNKHMLHILQLVQSNSQTSERVMIDRLARAAHKASMYDFFYDTNLLHSWDS